MTWLKNVEVLKKIGETNSTNEKIQYLKDNENEEMKAILKFIFDCSFTSGIASKKINKSFDIVGIKPFSNDLLTMLQYLKENNTGTDEVIKMLQAFICNNENHIPEEYRETIKEIFCKSLKNGLGIKGVNKAFDNLLEDYEVMLAEAYHEVEDKISGKKVLVSLKLDGNRCTLFNKNGKKYIRSRGGLILEGFEEMLNHIFIPENNVIDGEMISKEGKTSKERYDLTTKIISKKGTKRGLIFNAFDTLPIEDFESKNNSIQHKKRMENLKNIVALSSEECIKYVDTFGVFDIDTQIDEIFELLEKVTKNGEEGLMANVIDAPYEFKRTHNIVKFKKFKEVDLLCTGVIEGKGKMKGTLGSIIVDFNGQANNVGSGFKKKFNIKGEEINKNSTIRREEIWGNKEIILGKIVTVRYFEETKDGNMRFPRIKCIRDDKTEPSYN